MTDKTLAPVDGDEKSRQVAKRQQARQQRQRALALQKQRQLQAQPGGPPVPAEEAPAQRVPDMIRPEAFVLPPRAEMERTTSRFGRFVKMTFVGLVLLPTILCALFYAFVATDQYATQSAFAVRGNASMQSSVDLGGLFSLGTGAVDAEASDSYILQEYIHSREMVEILIEEANFIEIYSRPSADAYYRLDPDGAIEDYVDYWTMMSHVDFDIDTGIIHMSVRAFRPADAETITAKVIEKSEQLVNELSRRAREDSVRQAREEVSLAEERFAESRKAVAAYRGTEREIDPTAVAETRQTLVGELEAQVALRESELRALLSTMSEESPRVVYVENQLAALRRQIRAERERVATEEEGYDQVALTERLSRFEELLAEREFAEKAYVSALAALEQARVEALRQQRYLAVFVRGAAPEDALYPEALRWTAILFGALLLGWGVICLVGAAIRDRFV
jgi:capsular polysaccharide transport system permease protein